MPANLHYFLTKYLDIVRVHPAIFETEKDQESILTGDHELLGYCGYLSFITQNLNCLLMFILALIAFIMLLAVIDLIKRRSSPGRSCTAWTANFSIRFGYEMFLEIMLCALIQIAIKPTGVGLVVAWLIIVSAAVLVVFLIS